MEKQFKILRTVIITIGFLFFCVGAGIAYQVYTAKDAETVTQDYIMPMVFMFVGLMDIFTVLIWTFVTRNKSRKELLLKENGYSVRAKVVSVELNQNIRMNRRSPYIIVCQWQDPLSSSIHVFKSKNIWFDPSRYIDHSRTINVFCDPNNLKSYVVDISFLPENG